MRTETGEDNDFLWFDGITGEHGQRFRLQLVKNEDEIAIQRPAA